MGKLKVISGIIDNKNEIIIGGYKFTVKEEGLILTGQSGKQWNLNELPIMNISIMPIKNNFRVKNKNGNDTEIEHELEDDKIYYYLSYVDRYFIFENKHEALMFLNIIVDYKTTALKIKQKHKKDSCETTK